MHGYGSHTFKMVNDKDEFVWVKFHFRVKNLFIYFQFEILFVKKFRLIKVLKILIQKNRKF